jgi:hypothetical protein
MVSRPMAVRRRQAVPAAALAPLPLARYRARWSSILFAPPGSRYLLSHLPAPLPPSVAARLASELIKSRTAVARSRASITGAPAGFTVFSPHKRKWRHR